MTVAWELLTCHHAVRIIACLAPTATERCSMKHIELGFTLVELMIVVGIIGVLATVALPTYHDYSTRSRITEGLVMAASAKSLVSENAADGSLSLSDGWTLPPATDNVASIAVGAAGVIKITYTAKGQNVVLSLTPTSGGAALVAGTPPTGGSIEWKCDVGGVVAMYKYVPQNCRA
jgi:type IV pilus assembly protein PilA